MMLARQAANLAKGRSRQSVRAAAEAAADVLVGMIQPFAGPVIEQHKAAGRRLVMATTTPVDLVRPLAERLGFDDVVATTYGVNADGTYDGTIVGPFVWANGKLEAVREWAARHDIDMRASYAYSDSVYDTPLLSAVGHPVAVNPDPRLLLMALSRRWPILHLDVPPGVPKLPLLDLEPQQVAVAFTRPSTVPYARWDISGVEHIPGGGPGHPGRQPPLLLRRSGDDAGDRPQRPPGSLPREEGGVRRARRGAAGQGDGRDPLSSGPAVRTSHCGSQPRRWRQGRWSR